MTDVQSLVERLHEQLEATEQLPVERTASRWIGEAQAVAGDAVDAPPEVVRKRVDQVADLLSNVDETGDETADEHVRQAEELTREIQNALRE